MKSAFIMLTYDQASQHHAVFYLLRRRWLTGYHLPPNVCRKITALISWWGRTQCQCHPLNDNSLLLCNGALTSSLIIISTLALYIPVCAISYTGKKFKIYGLEKMRNDM